MSSQVAPPPPPRRTSFTQKRPSMASKKSSAPPPQPPAENGTTNASSKPTSPSSSGVGGERTVKKLRLSKALTIPEGTSVSDACRRMAARRVDAVLLTDSNALLSGIVTDKDITARVIAEELRPEQTIVSKIMTRNPIFVTSDTSAIEALQKMVQGKFRHLPVVENGEVIALLDITKCLYDAISRMEKAAEQGSAIAAAVEGVERQMGNNFSAPAAFIETLRERMFKPALSTIILENTKVATVSPSDPVYVAAKKMKEFRVNSVIITSGIKVLGILTSKDILMRVVAQNLSPELTLVEKVMTPNPEYASVESTILEALHIMHDGKFLHLPVLDRDGSIVACVDVLTLTHAAISMAENSSGMNDMANSMMQKFWDSALALEPPDDSDSHSEMSAAFMNSEGTDLGRYPSLGLGSSISYKFEDPKGRVHRFSFGTENLDELVSAVMQRTGSIDSDNRPQLLYEDDEGDKILLTCDSDLIGAALHARSAGQKMDEDKHFLDMLDAATESVFEAYTGKMAAGSCTVVVPQPEQVVQYSQGLQQGKELGSQLSFRTTFPSESSGSLNEPQHRRKRCRTCEEPNFQGLVTKQNNLGLGDRNQLLNSNNHFNSWPQNFTFQSNGVNTSVGGFKSKHSSFLANSHCQLPKKWPSRIQRNSSSTGAFDLGVSNIVESEKKVMENSVDFSKEIEDAINRIESLIPSLQKLVNPPKQESMFNSGLPKISSSVNPTMKKKDWVSTRNEIYHTEKLATPGENKVGKQAGQMFTTCNVPSHVKWTRNKTNLKARINQFPGPKVKAGMGRPGSLKGTPSRNGSFASHNPVRIQGLRIMPHESSIKGSIEKDKTSSPCSRVQSMGSTNFMRRNRNVGTSHQKRRRNRTVMPRDSLDRNNAAIRRNMNEASHSKITSDDRTSDETSWGSCASPSATTQQSGSSFSSSGTYESSGSKFYDSDESKPRHETASRSITESSASDYDDTASSSYYNSRSEYSDVDHSSQTSSVQRHKWNVQKERGKRREGRLKRLRKKLGMVFHHHHHHHHHYSDKDEPDAHHASSFWARLGDMFHHTKNKADHHQKTKAEKPRKSEIKTVVKRKQQGPHFHALVDGLMKHMKHSKKPKQVKNGIKGLENARHRGKKLPCLPKIHGRRGGVKVSNKGKVKLGNYRSKSMAAAKLFLGK